jgi:serine/threonine protein kinase
LLIETINGYKVKLTDFGLSTYHEFIDQSHSKYTGDRRYRAPEIDGRKYNTKADIYSLGVIMQILFNFDIERYILQTSN